MKELKKIWQKCQNKAIDKKFTYFKKSILSGVCIGLGGAIFVKFGGIVGAIMFAFGLLTVIYYKLPLYTGIAGFINIKQTNEWYNMFIALIGNIIGCYLLSLLFLNNETFDTTNIIQSRIDSGFLQSFLNAIRCGTIMTLIVHGARNGNQLLVLFGIPLFILLGFYHSIADAFYASLVNYQLLLDYMPYYLLIILGNFVGCNIPRVFSYNK